MDLSHHFTVPASLDETWAAMNHPELVVACFPGATLSSVDGLDFVGELKVKLGTTTLAYTGTGAMVERQAGNKRTIVAEAQGFDRRGNGTLDVTGTTTMVADGDGTAVDLVLACRFTGRPGQFDPQVIEDAARRVFDQFASGLSDRFSHGLGAEALAADADDVHVSPLGRSASSSSPTQTFNPLSSSPRTDFEVFRTVAPVLVRRFLPPLLGGVSLLWLVRKLTTPRDAAGREQTSTSGPTADDASVAVSNGLSRRRRPR